MNIIEDKNGASVKFPPPIVFLIFMLIAYGADIFYAVKISHFSFLYYLGLLCISSGFIIFLLASISFKRHQTNIKPWKPTTHIISSGIYAYSRNPIYLSFCIVTIGAGLTLNNLWLSLSFLPSIIVIFFMAIKKEELYLESKFGEEYLNYKENVRRWI